MYLHVCAKLNSLFLFLFLYIFNQVEIFNQSTIRKKINIFLVTANIFNYSPVPNNKGVSQHASVA